MKKIHCGISGTSLAKPTSKLSDIQVSSHLKDALIDFFGGDSSLRPAQEEAIFANELLELRTNILLCTPTNSGKSLLAYLVALREAQKGFKAIIVEPLRALAQEKVDELKYICNSISRCGGPEIKVNIATGDYRQNDEFYSDRPKTDTRKFSGEVIVATPERLDAISRVKENAIWFKDVSIICIDEAHLLGDRNRGATFEMLITFFKSLQNSPQIMLISATIGNPEEIADWLKPCKVISLSQRYPQLDKNIVYLDEGDSSDSILIEMIQEILKDQGNSVLVFVYRTDTTEKLARQISKLQGKNKGSDLAAVISNGVAWYHSNMSFASRNAVREAVLSRKVRVVVSTTSLAMGVNLPSSHVIIRDIVFPGVKKLDTSEIMQMLGRAGRGDNNGVGVVFCKHSDGNLEELESSLRNEVYPEVKSQFYNEENGSNWRINNENDYRKTHQIIGLLHRLGPTSLKNIEGFLENSWGGNYLKVMLIEQLKLLVKWKLAYYNDDTGEYSLTKLGQVSSKAYLPPIAAANIGQLIRDLIQNQSDGNHLAQFTAIDSIILLCLTCDELKPVVRYSKDIESKITSYMERLPISEKSYLFRQWISTDPVALWGSVCIDNRKLKEKDAIKEVHQATYLAMLIYDLSKGVSVQDINSRYLIEVQEIEEKLRDVTLWLLASLEKIFEVKNFYYHLKSVCNASFEDTRKVEKAFRRNKSLVYALLPNLKYKSSLGQLVRGIKKLYPNAKSHPGEATIKKLEEMGINSLRDLLDVSPRALVSNGINQNYADMICGYIKRRRV
ncbi:hypothetical protein YDYSG_27510 [Paenibacillus tyrfis]|uniref:DEAD/DEAH box helicase n=1 Tax=Paenibacillus tyrfis TaxID=1501230 RepID=UPI002491CB09|nr:DEAD/DEAH box helicase [Paenibacillus tyrfis]GLI06721.1 hypothetical protein YDYSG_27510 [Paenibacillus tyrfis]